MSFVGIHPSILAISAGQFGDTLSRPGRIRDIETGPDGNVYILLEHAEGGKILRMVPGA